MPLRRHPARCDLVPPQPAESNHRVHAEPSKTAEGATAMMAHRVDASPDHGRLDERMSEQGLAGLAVVERLTLVAERGRRRGTVPGARDFADVTAIASADPSSRALRGVPRQLRACGAALSMRSAPLPQAVA